jgi:hypothetical protein
VYAPRKPYPQIFNQAERLVKDKHVSLFVLSVDDDEKKSFLTIAPGGEECPALQPHTLGFPNGH